MPDIRHFKLYRISKKAGYLAGYPVQPYLLSREGKIYEEHSAIYSIYI